MAYGKAGDWYINNVEGGVVLKKKVITGTLKNPFGSYGASLWRMMKEHTAFAVIDIDATSVLREHATFNLITYNGPSNYFGANASGISKTGDAVEWTSSAITWDYSTVTIALAYMNGNTMDLLPYADQFASELTVYYTGTL